MIPPSLSEQIAELQREVKLREWLYPKWEAQGKYTKQKLDEQLGRMRAALATIEAVKERSQRECKPPLTPSEGNLFDDKAPF